MPSDIQGILLKPAPGDPHGLLKEGPCGARPPMAGKHDGYWYEYESDGALGLVVEQPDGHWDSPEPDARALVLAWDGKPVAEGMDRAARVSPHYRSEAWNSARAMGREMERFGYGALVQIDAEGRKK